MPEELLDVSGEEALLVADGVQDVREEPFRLYAGLSRKQQRSCGAAHLVEAVRLPFAFKVKAVWPSHPRSNWKPGGASAPKAQDDGLGDGGDGDEWQ